MFCFFKKVGIFVDGPNMLRKDSKVDLFFVKKKAKEYGFITLSNVYLDQHAPKKLLEAVINQGFKPIVASGDVDVALASDLVYFSLKHSLSVVVLVTRDSDFVPAISRIKEVGKKVVIFASPKGFSRALEHHADEVVIAKEINI